MSNRTLIRISAKTLGGLALPDFCPRCFWIQMRAKPLPFQTPFPGIFSSIDSYEKKLIEGWFDRHGGPPPWLAPIGKIKSYKKPPGAAQFQITDEATGILLTGAPDAVFVMEDGSNAIIDYKTAKFTATQDELFPLYETQLNAYAVIGERAGLAPVKHLALVYTEPVTSDDVARRDSNFTPEGFLMGFSAYILHVQIQPALVHRLLKRVREIVGRATAPKGVEGCPDCARLSNLISLIGG